MIPEVTHYPVNWIDGMKVSKKHFLDTNDAFYDMLRDASALPLTNFNYGLLPPVSGNKKSLEMEVLDTKANNFRVRLLQCRAVTAGGCRIEIFGSFSKAITHNQQINLEDSGKNVKGMVFYILIAANPFSRQPVGQPNPDESPVRYPYTNTDYQLQILPADQVNQKDFGSYHFPVGKIYFKGDEFHVDEKFIPPCTSVISHPMLIEFYKSMGSSLEEMKNDAAKIILKIISKNQTTPLAMNVKFLCERIADFIAGIFYQYRLIVYQMPPVFMVDYFSRLAHIILITLERITEKEKEELLNYFNEWTEINPSNFESLLSDLIYTEYDHNNIYASVINADKFATMVANLLNKLSTLELIGKKKERDIFVRERNANEPVEKKGRGGWSMLD